MGKKFKKIKIRGESKSNRLMNGENASHFEEMIDSVNDINTEFNDKYENETSIASKQMKNNFKEEETDGKNYCIEDCIYKTNQDNNSESHVKWIGCHNKESCEIEWYHTECLGIEETPKGNWYCPLCKDNKDRKKSKKR